MLTVYDDEEALVLDSVDDEPVVPVRDTGVVDAEPEFDMTDEPDPCTAP
ncbi:hypothetical protein LMG27177_07495 [Paraburkholderia fynbosensis]|uniref:Uncharacterized protein n=1 Tax=Paraburkholderia fynbosensis TaxID=1200993 RepID=A0A6J5H5L2_9BURK|nr:hypothetical protein LMG27177_07495 [Paraburkholderia fynbosensis]